MLGSSKPAISLNSVVFPAPLGPRMVKNSRSLMCRLLIDGYHRAEALGYIFKDNLCHGTLFLDIEDIQGSKLG